MTIERPATARAEKLDDLLSRWHSWANAQRSTGKGYGNKSLVVGDYQTSRQYDDTNGALDDALEATTMRAVDFAVRQMGEPHRTAIYVQARALCLGTHAFSSPRLPSDPEAKRHIVSAARDMLTARLIVAGVL